MSELPDIAVLQEGKASYLQELETVLRDAGVEAHIIQPPDARLNS